jgi:hypothetical protein
VEGGFVSASLFNNACHSDIVAREPVLQAALGQRYINQE